jgi:hypothetical protein
VARLRSELVPAKEDLDEREALRWLDDVRGFFVVTGLEEHPAMARKTAVSRQVRSIVEECQRDGLSAVETVATVRAFLTETVYAPFVESAHARAEQAEWRRRAA